MFGGTSPGESATSTRVDPTTTHATLSGRSVQFALPATTVVLVLALALFRRQGASEELLQLLLITSGAMYFGAGLLQLATWSISHRAAHCIRGAALAAPGLAVLVLVPIGGAWRDLAEGPPAFAVTVLLAGSSIVAFSLSLAAFLALATHEGERLSSAEMALHAATQAARNRTQEQRDIRHDARNALFALRMASQALDDVGDRLDEETRQRLRGAVLTEVGHLDELISRSTTSQSNAAGAAKEPTGLVPSQRPDRATEWEAGMVAR